VWKFKFEKNGFKDDLKILTKWVMGLKRLDKLEYFLYKDGFNTSQDEI
jgi:hypothetical protein